MKRKTSEEILAIFKEFKKKCFDHGKFLDPGDEWTWDAMAAGFMLAKGVPLRQAKDFAWFYYQFCEALEKSDEHALIEIRTLF